MAKIVTHSGQILNVFVVNKNPVLFEDRNGALFPTVTLLWRFPGESIKNEGAGGLVFFFVPGILSRGNSISRFLFVDLLPRIRTWEAVYHKLCGGADLMLPGVVIKGKLCVVETSPLFPYP